MQCDQLRLQITRDQPDNIKLYDRKIEAKADKLFSTVQPF